MIKRTKEKERRHRDIYFLALAMKMLEFVGVNSIIISAFCWHCNYGTVKGQEFPKSFVSVLDRKQFNKSGQAMAHMTAREYMGLQTYF